MIDGYYFSIRILVRHPSMPVADLTVAMGDEPNHSGEPHDQNGAFWSLVSETTGKRDFFSEVSEIVSWLEGRRKDIRCILATGGSIQVIVQLPGDRNIGAGVARIEHLLDYGAMPSGRPAEKWLTNAVTSILWVLFREYTEIKQVALPLPVVETSFGEMEVKQVGGKYFAVRT